MNTPLLTKISKRSEKIPDEDIHYNLPTMVPQPSLAE